MKIVLFSDIHANLPALEAFFEEVDKLQPDAIYCLGDLVGYNIWPNEVVNAIRARQIPTISGNHDAVVGLPTDKPSGVYVNAHITNDVKEYLLSLPAHIRLEHIIDGKRNDVLFVHGSPKRNNEYLLAETDDNYLLALMHEAKTSILCAAHTHKPFHRAIATENGCKHVINIGSLGKPKDGDKRGCFALLEIDKSTSLKSPEGLKVSFHRVAYDVEKAAQAVENSTLPNAFAIALREAK